MLSHYKLFPGNALGTRSNECFPVHDDGALVFGPRDLGVAIKLIVPNDVDVVICNIHGGHCKQESNTQDTWLLTKQAMGILLGDFNDQVWMRKGHKPW